MRPLINILAVTGRTITVLALTLAMMPVKAAFAADRYTIDPAHCHIGFSVRHIVINNIRGRFTDYAGSIIYDEQDITRSSVEITIKAQSINTDVNARDEHLRTAEFFDVAKYPDITFKSSRIEKRGASFVAVGMFTMHGVAKEIAIPFKVNGKSNFQGATHLGVESTLVIDRRDFGMNWSATLDTGGLVVGNDVTIELNIEAIRK
ncbi:MAG TPA: YceI family protein [Pyrinomonadaceae bacterium]|nr:YceI family protein [Pyrinomonadaceae bacterium]